MGLKGNWPNIPTAFVHPDINRSVIPGAVSIASVIHRVVHHHSEFQSSTASAGIIEGLGFKHVEDPSSSRASLYPPCNSEQFCKTQPAVLSQRPSEVTSGISLFLLGQLKIVIVAQRGEGFADDDEGRAFPRGGFSGRCRSRWTIHVLHCVVCLVRGT